jgi:hypothetical protein
MGWNREASRRRADRDGAGPPPRAARTPDAAGDGDVPGGFWPAVEREIDRCRRYRHPLSLVRVAGHGSAGLDPIAPRSRREGRTGLRRRDRRTDLAVELRATLRSGDTAWRHGAAVYVLAPETDAVAAEALVARIRPVAVRLLGAPADIRLAAFPEHGVTAHGLRRALEAREPRFAARPSAGRAATWVAFPRLADAPELRESAD